MIWRLFREQWRAGHLTAGSALVVTTVLLAVASFAAFQGVNKIAAQDYMAEATGQDGGSSALVTVFGPNTTFIDLEETEYLTLPLADFNSEMNRATGEDPSLSASTLTLGQLSANGVPASTVAVSILWNPSWFKLLMEGVAPSAGQIVIDGDLAADAGLSVGDTVALIEGLPTGDAGAGGLAPTTFTISGLAFRDPEAGFPATYMSPSDFEVLPSVASLGATAALRWDGSSAFANRADREDGTTDASLDQPSTLAQLTDGSEAAWVAFSALAIGVVITSLATARAQAVARSRWTSTARALGAKRSQLVGAAAIEMGLLACAGGFGAMVGWAASAAVTRRLEQTQVARPHVEAHVPLSLALALGALALVIAAVAAGAPTLHMLRMHPNTALKESPVADEAEYSRRLPAWGLYAAAIVAWLATTLLFGSLDRPNLVSILLLLTCATLVLAATVEALRALVRALGAACSRSRRGVIFLAGAVLTGHPRALTALALVTALAATVVSAVLADGVSRSHTDSNWIVGIEPGSNGVTLWDGTVSSFPGGIAGLMAVGAATIFLGAALTTATRAVTSADQSLAAGLGLSRRRVLTAVATSWSIAQALGAFVGSAVGFAFVASVQEHVLGASMSVTSLIVAVTLTASHALINLVVALVWAGRPAGAQPKPASTRGSGTHSAIKEGAR